MSAPELDEEEVCECGDFKSTHIQEDGSLGPCRWCAKSHAPYDNCSVFRFAHMEKRYRPPGE